MLLKYKGILIIKLYKKSDHCLLKLDQLQVNSHWKLNLNCTLKKIAKAKIGLVCRLCSTVRIVKKNTKSIFQFLPWSDLEIEPSKHQWNCLNGFFFARLIRNPIKVYADRNGEFAYHEFKISYKYKRFESANTKFDHERSWNLLLKHISLCAYSNITYKQSQFCSSAFTSLGCTH